MVEVEKINTFENIYKIEYKKMIIKILMIYKFNGDFIESQAFGYLAIRSFLELPIHFQQLLDVKIKLRW